MREGKKYEGRKKVIDRSEDRFKNGFHFMPGF